MDVFTILYIALGIAVLMLLALRRYLKGQYCKASTRLDGKVVIITGGNTGIGKETAVDMVRRGARVYIACRSLERGNEAASYIKTKSGGDSIYVRHLNLASFKSIRKFAQEFHEEERRLDILINNAGVMMCPYMKTEDGIEMQFGVNHVGHFLLTHCLLDMIKASAPSRIVNVSSLAQKQGHINFADLNSEKSYSSIACYQQSKLANVLFTRKLAKLVEGSGVSVFSLHPGSVLTDLGRHLFPFLPSVLLLLLKYMCMLVLLTPEEGAQTSIYCAVQPGLEKYSGKYFADCQVEEPCLEAQDDRVADKLWEVSEKLCRL